jgi:hypothetical protein
MFSIVSCACLLANSCFFFWLQVCMASLLEEFLGVLFFFFKIWGGEREREREREIVKESEREGAALCSFLRFQ